MNKFFVIVFFALISCKSNAQLLALNKPIKKQIDCTEEVVCKIELLPNKSIEFKKDEFGMRYPVITEGNNILLKYEYDRIQNPGIADDFYTEYIYAELSSSLSSIQLKDEGLSNIKLHLGRLCFCKGTNGYFPIKSGTFSLEVLNEHSVRVQIDFSVKNIPHKVASIDEIISLKSD